MARSPSPRRGRGARRARPALRPAPALAGALPVVLVAVALYFAFAPRLDETLRPPRLSLGGFAATLAPAIGFYDGVFGPGAGSFYMVALVALCGFGLIRAMAGARFANFGCNVGSLALYAVPATLSSPPVWRWARRLPRRAARRRLALTRRRAAGPAADRRHQWRDGAEARQRAGNALTRVAERALPRLTARPPPLISAAKEAGRRPGPKVFQATARGSSASLPQRRNENSWPTPSRRKRPSARSPAAPRSTRGAAARCAPPSQGRGGARGQGRRRRR